MNTVRCLAFVSGLLVLSPALAAQQSSDMLLSALGHARDAESAKKIEDQLITLWSHSGSPTADLLLKRARAALEHGDMATGRKLLASLTTIAPDFAEGWHARAAASLDADDYTDALMSFHRALQLQPRHFDAWASLGGVLEDLNEKPEALDAYRRALAIDPWAAGVKERERELERDVEGQSL